MPKYIYNPKTLNSGIICAIPQKGECPVGCPDCFYNGGRSFLAPLNEHTPNMPSAEQAIGQVVRYNDGYDSGIQRVLVIESSKQYEHKFFNTSIPKHLDEFPGPVVLTLNPGSFTDSSFIALSESQLKNVMFVRFRVNMWNLQYCDVAVRWYTSRGIVVVLTFMAYYLEPIPEEYKKYYTFKKRTLNDYWSITEEGWNEVVSRYEGNKFVRTCGKNPAMYSCKDCGNCKELYFKKMLEQL